MSVKALVVLEIEVSPGVKFNSGSVGGPGGEDWISGKGGERKVDWNQK